MNSQTQDEKDEKIKGMNVSHFLLSLTISAHIGCVRFHFGKKFLFSSKLSLSAKD